MSAALSTENPAAAAAAADVPVPAQPPVSPVSHERRGRGRYRFLAYGGLAVVVLAGALAAGALPRLRQQQALAAAAAQTAAAPPRVTVAAARPAPPQADRVLPGNAEPLMHAGLFARVTGYVETRLVDVGDRVQQGQVLAVVSAPDLDDQLNQARANLEQARASLKLNEANYTLAKTILARSVAINSKGSGFVSQEQIDQERATVGTSAASVENARASIQVNEAAVQRFADLQHFEKITAPFPGVITARTIDPGDLMLADSPTTTREMFHLMRTDVLRVFVNVPQVFATGIKVGQEAAVYQRDDPSKQFAGKVARTADALDPNTRKLLTEVEVPNPDNALRPGMYLQVKFVFNRTTPSLRIPAAAIVVRNGPRMVAVLDAQHAVHYRDVQLGRDFGNEIEVLTGLNAGETVVIHPGDDLPEGTVVEPVPLSAS